MVWNTALNVYSQGADSTCIQDDFDEGDDDNEEAPPPPTEDNFMPAYPEETQVLMSVADAAREEYNKAEKEYNEVDREIQWVCF